MKRLSASRLALAGLSCIPAISTAGNASILSSASRMITNGNHKNISKLIETLDHIVRLIDAKGAYDTSQLEHHLSTLRISDEQSLHACCQSALEFLEAMKSSLDPELYSTYHQSLQLFSNRTQGIEDLDTIESSEQDATHKGLVITANSGISANATSIINLQGGNTTVSGTLLIDPSPSTTAISATGTIGSTSIRLNATGSGSLTQRATPTTTSYTLTWPNAAATSSGQALTSDTNGNLSWTTVVTPANAIVNGGNTFGTSISIGSNDSFSTSIRTSGTDRLTISATGGVSVLTNLDLPNTTTSVGLITKAANRFIHNFGTNNTFMGVNAGNLTLTTATNNIGIGISALSSLTTGSNNVAVGNNVLTANTTGSNNTALGYQALLNNASGSNTAVGSNALNANTIGYNNVGVGFNSLTVTSTGINNTAVGVEALKNNTTDNLVAVGFQALALNNTGTNNTAVGTQALAANTSGTNNTAVGFNALLANTTGITNTAVGDSALASSNTRYSTAIGYQSLFSTTTGDSNTAVGASSLFANTSGSNNCAIGISALTANTTGSSNTALGYFAMFSATTGTQNTAVGFGSLGGITTGSNNLALGYNAGTSFANTGVSNTIVIGDPGNGTTASNTIKIGNFATPGTYTSCYIDAISGKTSSGGVAVLINASGQLGTLTSSRRFKENIVDIEPSVANKVLQLRPVEFNYIADETKSPEWGLIAEEVDKLFPQLTAYDKEGNIETVRYHILPTLLLHVIKQQDRTIKDLMQRVTALEQR